MSRRDRAPARGARAHRPAGRPARAGGGRRGPTHAYLFIGPRTGKAPPPARSRPRSSPAALRTRMTPAAGRCQPLAAPRSRVADAAGDAAPRGRGARAGDPAAAYRPFEGERRAFVIEAAEMLARREPERAAEDARGAAAVRPPRPAELRAGGAARDGRVAMPAGPVRGAGGRGGGAEPGRRAGEASGGEARCSPAVRRRRRRRRLLLTERGASFAPAPRQRPGGARGELADHHGWRCWRPPTRRGRRRASASPADRRARRGRAGQGGARPKEARRRAGAQGGTAAHRGPRPGPGARRSVVSRPRGRCRGRARAGDERGSRRRARGGCRGSRPARRARAAAEVVLDDAAPSPGERLRGARARGDVLPRGVAVGLAGAVSERFGRRSVKKSLRYRRCARARSADPASASARGAAVAEPGIRRSRDRRRCLGVRVRQRLQRESAQERAVELAMGRTIRVADDIGELRRAASRRGPRTAPKRGLRRLGLRSQGQADHAPRSSLGIGLEEVRARRGDALRASRRRIVRDHGERGDRRLGAGRSATASSLARCSPGRRAAGGAGGARGGRARSG